MAERSSSNYVRLTAALTTVPLHSSPTLVPHGMSPNVHEFVRVEKTGKEFRIFVRKIRWDGPHKPASTWLLAKTLPDSASRSAVEVATSGILEDHRYFLTCHECGKRNPLGWMHSASLCQGYAEANHGIVH